MKLVFVSDIHGSAYYARMLPEIDAREKPERIVLLGDLLYHGPRNDLPRDYNPKEVTAILNGMKQRFLCVRGNCDAEVDQMVLQFPIMADYALLPLDGGRCAFVTHGHLFNTECPPPHRSGDVLIHGHTHVHCALPQGDYTYLNPGSAALPKEGQPKSYMIYEDGLFSIRALETGKELLAWRLGQ